MVRRHIYLEIVLVFSALVANAQLTKSDADYLALNIVNDTTVVVYGMSETLGFGESIMTAEGHELRNPYTNSYVYFVNDMPAANWVHPCRYIYKAINSKH